MDLAAKRAATEAWAELADGRSQSSTRELGPATLALQAEAPGASRD